MTLLKNDLSIFFFFIIKVNLAYQHLNLIDVVNMIRIYHYIGMY